MTVLLLDNTYEPIRVIGWTRAMRLVFSGKAEIVEQGQDEVRSVNSSWKVPSVIRQTGKFKRKGEVQFSRINIYMRDGWKCQYCGKKKHTKELTFDHVQPTSKGGKTNWLNIVTACRTCNLKKADKTPEEANMKLMKAPEKPKWLPQQMILRMKNIPKEWEPYVDMKSLDYWTTELESN
jgi:5-methylcytosine-specific restriction endonuclease McrA